MANPNAIPLNLDTELGKAIKGIIAPTGYGDSTFIVKEFMEKHKKQLIKFWNSQGKDGVFIFDKWFMKWSMTTEQQQKKNELKEEAKLKKRKEKYLSLGCSDKKAHDLARNFPKENPLTVMKTLTYASQNEVLETEQISKCHNCGEPYGSNPDNCKSCKKKMYEDALKKMKERPKND